MIRAVLFDVGGVIHTESRDPEREHAFAGEVLSILAEQGIDPGVPEEVFLEKLRIRAREYKKWSEETTIELPAPEIWGRFFLKDFGIGPERIAPWAERLCDLYDARQRLTVRPHLLETVKALNGRGLRQGIVSNIISRNFIPRCLEQYGIAPYMECVILSSVVGRRKPAGEIFAAATGALGLSPGDCAYVGDRLSRDVIGAKGAGFGLMIQIRHPPSIEKDRAFEGLGYRPDAMIEDLAEIPGLIAAYCT